MAPTIIERLNGLLGAARVDRLRCLALPPTRARPAVVQTVRRAPVVRQLRRAASVLIQPHDRAVRSPDRRLIDAVRDEP